MLMFQTKEFQEGSAKIQRIGLLKIDIRKDRPKKSLLRQLIEI